MNAQQFLEHWEQGEASQNRKRSSGSLERVVGQRATMSCGCPDATIKTTRCYESIDGGELPEVYQGYTCKCGKCFYANPTLPNISS